MEQAAIASEAEDLLYGEEPSLRPRSPEAKGRAAAPQPPRASPEERLGEAVDEAKRSRDQASRSFNRIKGSQLLVETSRFLRLHHEVSQIRARRADEIGDSEIYYEFDIILGDCAVRQDEALSKEYRDLIGCEDPDVIWELFGGPGMILDRDEALTRAERILKDWS